MASIEEMSEEATHRLKFDTQLKKLHVDGKLKMTFTQAEYVAVMELLQRGNEKDKQEEEEETEATENQSLVKISCAEDKLILLICSQLKMVIGIGS